MFCPNCGAEHSETDHFCGGCGSTIRKEHPNPNKKTKWLYAGILTAVLILGVSLYSLFIGFNSNAVVKETPAVENLPNKLVEKVPEPVIKMERVSSNDKDKTIVIKEALPKVFTIFTAEGLGSGFLYKEGGLIVTNAHVVAGYTDVIVRNSNGQDSPGKVIGISDRSDVALIQATEYKKAKPLQTEIQETLIGTEVIALGSPQGFENSASIGYLTGLNRDMELGFIYDKVYQIDAQIDQGSSGGPLLDAKTGKVIGINSLIYKQNNLFGFSIPMYSVKDLIDKWAKNPMSETEVAAVFDVFDDYVYHDSASDRTDDYYDEDYEEYEDYYDYYDNYYEEYDDEDFYYVFDESSLVEFIQDFREYYEMALYYEDFYWIEDMLLEGSTAYSEFDDYINEVSGAGLFYEFMDNTVTDVDIFTDDAIVYTYETFELTNSSGMHSFNERSKYYRIILDADGFYKITDVRSND